MKKLQKLLAFIHYTTVYGWRGDLEAMGEDAYLAYKPSRPGCGVKHITEKQEKEILDVWENNPGYGPGQVRNQLRRQGITISVVGLIECNEIRQFDYHLPLFIHFPPYHPPGQ